MEKSNNIDRNITTTTLRVSETDSKFVGKGIAVIDPKAMKELQLAAGDVLEISAGSKKKEQLCFITVKPAYGLWQGINQN